MFTCGVFLHLSEIFKPLEIFISCVSARTRACLDRDLLQAPIKYVANIIKTKLCKWIKNKKNTEVGKHLNGAKNILTKIKNNLLKPINAPKNSDMEKWATFWIPFSSQLSESVQRGNIELRKIEDIILTNNLPSTDLKAIVGHVTKSFTGFSQVNAAVMKQMACFLDETAFGMFRYLWSIAFI